jgi:hypothetical protein
MSEPDLNHCANCGMPKSQWTRNDGQGVKRENVMYCCEGCAQDNRCICRGGRVTRDTKGRPAAPVSQP